MRLRHRAFATLSGLLACLFAFPVQAAYDLNMPRGVTPISQDIYDLHMTIFYICVAIGLVVFGVMFYAILRHRKARGVSPAKFHENTWVEIIWAVIPVIILVAMAIPATKVLIDMEDTTDAAVTIKVVGYQWKWQYEYLDDGLSFFSNLSTTLDEIDNKAAKEAWYLLDVDNPLVLPVGKKIRFLITSNDVIHSWWVPALGVKKDAVPGYIHEVWAKIDEPGVYRGQCAELCGANHGFMPVVVIAKPEAEYQAWLAEQKQGKALNSVKGDQKLSKGQLMSMGKKEYEKFCSACHRPDGQGMPPAFPALKNSPVATTGSIQDHIKLVLDGKPGTAMQAFGNQLNTTQIAAIVTYERNAWGNDTGDVVQPADVKAAQQAKP